MSINCGLGFIKVGSEYYYTDCCGNFITDVNNTGEIIEVSFNLDLANSGVGNLNTYVTPICSTPTPTPTPTMTPTNTATPTVTPTNTATPTPSITPSVTPSNSPVTRLQNNCDVVTLFELGVSCNVIQSPTESNPLGGILSVNVTGGTSPYSFFWVGTNQKSQTLNGVPAGTYQVIVTDYAWPDGQPDGVSDYTATTICELVGPVPTSTPTMTPTPTQTTPVQCVDLCLILIGYQGVPNFGPIQFVCDGTQNGRFRWTSDRYQIIWNLNNTRWEIYTNETPPVNNFLPGGGILASTTLNLIPDSAWTVFGGTDDYSSITMTRGNCPTVIPLQVNVDSTNSSCQGTTNCNGEILILAEDGYPPYLYSINGGITYSNDYTFTNLCPNTYSVVVTDSFNNTQTSSVSIGYDSSPTTYQLSLQNVGPATTTSVPNVSQTVTQQMTLVVTPALPVGVSVTFNLVSTDLLTFNGPGTGNISSTWDVRKNNQLVNTIVGPTTTVSQGNRPFCSPNTQIVNSRDYSSVITITNGDVVNITSTTVDTITNGQVAAQTNCTTNLIGQISASILTPTIVGNNCSSVIGSSRQVLTNNFTFVPTEPPTVLRCFGYLYNFYAITGSSTQSITSANNWSVPTEANFQTLINSVSNNSRALRLVDTTTYWNGNNTNATNTSGFSAKGSGIRDTISISGFYNLRQTVVYHSKTLWNLDSSKSISLQLESGQITPNLLPLTHNNRTGGSSVRLVKSPTFLSPGQTGTYVGNDGKTYNTICIGTQEWMSEDLTETKYRDFSDIPNVTSQATWAGLTTGAYCIYNNDPLNVNGCPEAPPLPEILEHNSYGAGVNPLTPTLCDPNAVIFYKYYSYASQGTSPAVGITLYANKTPNNVLFDPIGVSTFLTGVIGWNGGQKYRYTISGPTPGVITTINPCT